MYMHMFIFLVLFSVMSNSSLYGAVREYSLVIAEQGVSIQWILATGMTINGRIPGPTLFFPKGDTALIHVTNTMPVTTSIHWHGILVPPAMDGVPFITQVPISPGTTFTYEFPIRQTGTYWYHSHTELQEQQSGLYGSIVIEDNAHSVDRDYVVLLSDWTSDNPESIIKTLKRGSEWFSLEKGSSQSILGAAKAGRLGDYFKRELQRMPPMDIADVAYDYFLSNGKPEQLLAAKKGETVRLRIINGSATTYFHLGYAGGKMTIISADGQLVEPLEKDLFLIAVAETYDVLVTVPDDGAFELRATAHDGSGFTTTWIGTGDRHGVKAVPKPDLYAPMEHGNVGSLFALTPAGTMGMPDSLVDAGAFDNPGMAHGGHDMSKGMDGMEGMNHQGHDMMQHMPKSENISGENHPVITPEDNQEMDLMLMKMSMNDAAQSQEHGAKSEEIAHQKPRQVSTPVNQEREQEIESARKYGEAFGFLETDIASRVNLAGEGGSDRPLTPYSELKSRTATTLPKTSPIREVRLTLDGDMERYTWFLNNKPLSETDNILIKEGEVVRFIMINRTMMHHPMHLHGHFFRVINGQGDFSPLKHTVDVAPMTTTVIEFFGNEVGDWFFHCHLLYHMKSGMARMVHYRDFVPAEDVAEVRPQLYRDPYYFFGQADVMSNMTEGLLTLTNSRLAFEAAWEVGWQQVDETSWEGLVTVDYYTNRFTSFFLGADFLGEGSSSEDTRGIAGLRYLLPLYIRSTVWVDTDGGARISLEKEFELTPRLGLHSEVQYDSHDQWEGKIGLSYLVSKEISVIAAWHSEYEFGVGIQVRF